MKDLKGSRKVLVAVFSIIIAFVGAKLDINLDMFYYSIMGIAGSFFGSNIVEHGAEAYKAGKELSSRVVDIEELIKKAIEGKEDEEKTKTN